MSDEKIEKKINTPKILSPPRSLAELMADPIGNLRYDEIEPDGVAIKIDLDPKGKKLDYKVEVSGATKYYPIYSKFRIQGHIGTTADVTVPLKSSDYVALAMAFPATMFSQEETWVNGKQMDQYSDHIAQRYMYKNRTQKSGGYLNTVNGINIMDPSFTMRLARITNDLTVTNYITHTVTKSNIQTKTGALVDGGLAYTALDKITIADVAVNGTRLITFSDADADPLNPNTDTWALPGSYLLYANDLYKILTVPAGGKTIYVTGVGASVVDQTDDWKQVTLAELNLPAETFTKHAGFEVEYVPTLPIFDTPWGLPTGSYETRLIVDTSWAKNIVESLNVDRDETLFKVRFTKINFMPCLFDTTEVPNGDVYIPYEKIFVDYKPVTQIDYSDEFRVGKTCVAIGFMLQDKRVDSSTLYSSTKFIAGGFEKKIHNYQIKYAKQLQPMERRDVLFNDADDKLINQYTLMYYENMRNNGQYGSMDQMETYDEYVARGMYIKHLFKKSGDNKDKMATIKIKFSVKPDETNLFVFSHQQRYLKLTYFDDAVVATKVIEE